MNIHGASRRTVKITVPQFDKSIQHPHKVGRQDSKSQATPISIVNATFSAG